MIDKIISVIIAIVVELIVTTYGSIQVPNDITEKTFEENLQIHFIDVGQGDCTLIQYGDQDILIDCGTDDKGTFLQNYLMKSDVDKIEYLVLTHFDADHIGSADVIITKFDIDNILVTDYVKNNTTVERMQDAIEYKGYETIIPDAGYSFSIKDAVVEIVGPLDKYDSSNDSSLILKLTHKNNSFLFMGDAEESSVVDLVNSRYDIDVDVLKVGHHGSGDSTSKELIESISPDFAVISCGKENKYNHPHGSALNILKEQDIKLFRTDEQGSIVVTSNGETYNWNTAPTDNWNAGD